MGFFSEEQSAELKELFFESAQELLQTLNEDGLRLEKQPGDTEIVRSIRRTVHTLKGDSAACGYTDLSELAHELEDVLTPEIAARHNGRVAEVVLSAADTFHEMLAAYRGKTQPPAPDGVRAQIRTLIEAPAAAAAPAFAPAFAWTEYEQIVIADAAAKGQKIFFIALGIDPQCPMRAAAVQLARNVLTEAGRILAIHPDENRPDVTLIEAAVATRHKQAWLEKKGRIPAVVNELLVRPHTAPTGEEDVLGIQEAVEASAPTPASEEPLAEITLPTAADVKAAPVQTTVAGSASENLLRVDAEKIDAVLNLVGELIIGKSMLHQTMSEFDKRFGRDPLRARFADAMAFQARVLNDLQKSVMKIRMVPVEQLFRRFPRVVRDVARTEGKEVELVLSGENTDLDKSILDALAEPLTHLVRNAVDHGLETPAERTAAGKPAQGTVRLNAFHQGNQIVIEITDDGRGIDRAKVIAKAIERGLLSQEDAARLSDSEALNLIFHSGLSTAEHVTGISGRGVGMDVVRNVLERLKGVISIETDPGHGTRFQLKVPLTLAIIKALLFRVADRIYAVPLSSVVEITRADESEIHRVDQHEVLQTREEVLTLVRLSKLVRTAEGKKSKMFVVVINLAERKFGLAVDRLVGEEELVIKAVDDSLISTDMVSGASILGDGTVVLILNIPALVERLARTRAAEAHA
jgi:two-component system, chemotaxis family, sensor kinase CheA